MYMESVKVNKLQWTLAEEPTLILPRTCFLRISCLLLQPKKPFGQIVKGLQLHN